MSLDIDGGAILGIDGSGILDIDGGAMRCSAWLSHLTSHSQMTDREDGCLYGSRLNNTIKKLICDPSLSKASSWSTSVMGFASIIIR